VSVRVTGLTQGVGFRPFVHRLASKCGIAGHVGNDGLGVFCEAEGEPAAVTEFLDLLRREAPAAAIVQDVEAHEMATCGEIGFRIVPSDNSTHVATIAPPDRAICSDCAAELREPADRRHEHALIACTNCGPRYSMVTGVPYDRANTTMAGFELCPACRSEYEDPGDRRFHAQPTACRHCGPRLRFAWGSGAAQPSGDAAAITAAREVLSSGGILAVKGVGGYHLACNAADAAAVERLRRRKQRGPKPLAVMVRDLATAERLAVISETARTALTSPAAPIVLVTPTAAGHSIARSVAPATHPTASATIGLLLPYSGVHQLLLQPGTPDPPEALVMTSGNRADEPLCIDPTEAEQRLADIADAFLHHDRPIAIGCDDSVVRADTGRLIPIRRSRGFAPLPVQLPMETEPTLAVGGELKATLCLASRRNAVLSQHLGDVGSWETVQSLHRTVDHLQRITGIRPLQVVADLHPGYHSRRWAEDFTGERDLPLHLVQHHHAHLAALLAEHGWSDGPVLGVVFDGTGYGTDATIWGGELLLGDFASVERVGHLRPIQLPGGDAAIRRPARTAIAHLHAAGLLAEDRLPAVAATDPQERQALAQMLASTAGCTPTTSVGRLFDAMSSLLGVCHDSAYEGQAAMALEAVAASAAASADLAFEVTDGDPIQLDPAPMLARAAADLLRGRPAPELAAGFHHALAEAVLQAALLLRRREGVATVGLTGGVFQNALLLRLCAQRLERAGFVVLTHRQVPANDGGLALGQAAVVAAGGGI
jgi:hydrogenase maturation protein HypF